MLCIIFSAKNGRDRCTKTGHDTDRHTKIVRSSAIPMARHVGNCRSNQLKTQSMVGTWKSVFSVPPFSALVTVCMYNGCQKHTSENCGFHWLIYSVFHIFI